MQHNRMIVLHQVRLADVNRRISIPNCRTGTILRMQNISKEEIDGRIRETAELLDLTDVLEEHPFSLGKGQRQRVAVASILVLKPKILVVDEPTTGQDWDGIQSMMELIDKLHAAGTTIVMITHDMDVVARHANRAVVLCHGQVVLDGDVADVFSHTKELEEAYVSRPQIVELSHRLRDHGVSQTALTSGELAELICRAKEEKA